MKKSPWFAAILAFALFTIQPKLLLSQDTGQYDGTEVADRMHESLGRISTIKSLIIMGNLDSVREPAMWLAENDSVSGLPENYRPFVDQMRGYAREVVAAPDLQSAAVSVSAMARTCSNCHLANDVSLAFGFDSEPEGWADTVSHMQRHQWGIDRMWEGLIGPSDAAWDRGADMLVDVPLQPVEVANATTSEADAAKVEKIARLVHSFGSQSASTVTPDERSELFGEVLGLCAECHAILGAGPGSQ